jgi:hypothetical protein
MKTMHRISGITLCLAFAAAAPLAMATGDSQEQLKAEATVSQTTAQSTAMAKVPNGTIKSSELERENGKLVWSFDISSPSSKAITEVQVDAKTGVIVSNKQESAAEQANELKTDKDAMKSTDKDAMTPAKKY